MTLFSLSALASLALGQISLKNLSANSASLGTIISPEFAALTGIIFYDEKLSLILLLSMILSIGGTIISVSADKINFLDRIKIAINKLKRI
jgi:threonine/homoserine efflux transporter RhtA